MSNKKELSKIEKSESYKCGGNITVPSVRVRFCPTDTDETFDGTVIDASGNAYVVIPDEDLNRVSRWDKRRCSVIR